MKGYKIRKLGNAIKTTWRIALVVIILMSVSGYLLSAYGLKKHYIVRAEVYIESTDEVTHAEKTATAARLFSSPRMYDAINQRLREPFLYAELNSMMSFKQKNNSQIIEAVFDCPRSSDAYKLAELSLSLSQKVLDDFEANAQLRIISFPVEPRDPEFPDETVFTIAGAVIGAVMAVTGIIIIWKLDDTITRADNITEEYELPLLGELMDFDREIDYLGR